MAKKNPCTGCAFYKEGTCLFAGCSQEILHLSCERFGNNIYATATKKCHVCGRPDCQYAKASLQVQEFCHSFPSFYHERIEARDIEEEKLLLAKKNYSSWDEYLTQIEKNQLFTCWMQ